MRAAPSLETCLAELHDGRVPLEHIVVVEHLAGWSRNFLSNTRAGRARVAGSCEPAWRATRRAPRANDKARKRDDASRRVERDVRNHPCFASATDNDGSSARATQCAARFARPQHARCACETISTSSSKQNREARCVARPRSAVKRRIDNM